MCVPNTTTRSLCSSDRICAPFTNVTHYYCWCWCLSSIPFFPLYILLRVTRRTLPQPHHHTHILIPEAWSVVALLRAPSSPFPPSFIKKNLPVAPCLHSGKRHRPNAALFLSSSSPLLILLVYPHFVPLFLSMVCLGWLLLLEIFITQTDGHPQTPFRLRGWLELMEVETNFTRFGLLFHLLTLADSQTG